MGWVASLSPFLGFLFSFLVRAHCIPGRPQTFYRSKDDVELLILCLYLLSAPITGVHFHAQLVSEVLGLEPKASCMLSKHSSSRPINPGPPSATCSPPFSSRLLAPFFITAVFHEPTSPPHLHFLEISLSFYFQGLSILGPSSISLLIPTKQLFSKTPWRRREMTCTTTSHPTLKLSHMVISMLYITTNALRLNHAIHPQSGSRYAIK